MVHAWVGLISTLLCLPGSDIEYYVSIKGDLWYEVQWSKL